MIKTIADTIIWLAGERMKEERYQGINAAIVGVCGDVDLMLCRFMAKNKNDTEEGGNG